MKRRNNAGKREREARKRHGRARVWTSSMGAEVEPLKLGREHFRRWSRRFYAVADAEKPGESVR